MVAEGLVVVDIEESREECRDRISTGWAARSYKISSARLVLQMCAEGRGASWADWSLRIL